ncbi:type II toxin-antitoxin system VapC family toxin [Streptomyces sp. NBC_01020]|uniref:type II toxin-antitoxin system VapC family toxin n=1 Tax=unclassified Streptomyces TaxID=2593676 RepID=UPI0032491352|nr:type II toxin-antitoxin system VapC family toxin [Streptomyces sp. NBC_01020]WSX68309.1 type II toxin-antitoxin system VapC family toxin [Streptomyces sp. NBC_00932]
MTHRRPRGLLDTCVVIDLPVIDPALLPVEAAVSSIVLAELAQGVAMTKDPVEMMARAQRLADVEAEFAAVPFDREAARRFGTLVALTIRAKRDVRPRRMDLMIAATAAAQGLPLYTRNADGFKGLEEGVDVIPV